MDLYRQRLLMNRFGLLMSMVAMAVGLGIVTWILATLLVNGIGALNFSVFTRMTPPPGEAGGLLNAIVGSLLMVGASSQASSALRR